MVSQSPLETLGSERQSSGFVGSHVFITGQQTNLPWREHQLRDEKRNLCWNLGSLGQLCLWLSSIPPFLVSFYSNSLMCVCVCVCVCVHAHVCTCVWLFANSWTIVRQAPLSMAFSRRRYWSGLPFPSPGDLLNPGIKPLSLVSPELADRLFTTSTTYN